MNSAVNNKRLATVIFTMVALVIMIGFALPTSAQTTDFVTVYPTENSDFFTNPGIGWQRMEYNNPPLLEESVTYPTREDISWQVLNPGLGNYDWSVLDNKMQRAIDNGQLFSFRIYTMQGESYGGHKVPQWVLNRDNSIIQGGDPNYSNCTYQTYWGMFVNELRLRYDGNPNIAFIDISGYGNFNEWSWTDGQTVWDDSFTNPASIDGEARARLADMFIGGSDTSHRCVDSSGATQTTSYSYQGFQSTQMVMPYAGIQQSTRYVASRRSDVGIRYDCLGRDATLPKIDDVIEDTWRTAPIVFEFCSNLSTNITVMNTAETLLNASHGAIIHENLEEPRDELPVERLLTNVGYRYQLTQAVYDSAVAVGEELSLSMAWQNVGTAPAYTSMGYDFALHVYLVDNTGTAVLDYTSTAEVSAWMPAHPLPGTAPMNSLGELFQIPNSVQEGEYELRVAIINTVTNQPINLAIQGEDAEGRYLLGNVTIGNGGNGGGATQEPTTEVPVTEEPTVEPTTPAPTTEAPATEEPTVEPTTPAPASDIIYLSEVEGNVHRVRTNNWVVRFTIRVENGDGARQSGVTVSGSWHDGSSFSCITNNSGLCRVRKSRIAFDQAAYITVTSLTHADFSYDPSANLDSPYESVSYGTTPTEEPPTGGDVPTQVPPTQVPPTQVPPTQVPPTQVPPTQVPPTQVPPTQVPPTQVPPTQVPPTQVPPTQVPPTQVPPTQLPPTQVPPTQVPPPVSNDYVYASRYECTTHGQQVTAGQSMWTSRLLIAMVVNRMAWS